MPDLDAEAVSCEAALARLLGADRETALATAERVVASWPAVGVLTLSAVAAVRWGVDVLPAMERLAAGEPLHGAMSDYELRFASEEALDDLTARIHTVSDLRGHLEGEPQTVTEPHPELQAVEAALVGIRVMHLSPAIPRRAAARLAVLAEALQFRLVTAGEQNVANPDPPGVGSAYVGFGGIRNP